MAYTKYEDKRISADRLAVVESANAICEEYAAGGLVLTLRQLYYQFVARGLIANAQREYDRLGAICKDARMAGLMDWDHLIDRTRNLQTWKTYAGPQEAVKELADRYARDFWKPQRQRVEVWIEKDAAIGVVEGVCHSNGVPYFSCRGYTSVSEIHAAAQRVRWHIEQGEAVTILHVGDHDPSGLDMSRDIEDRLRTFIARDWAGLHMGFGAFTRREIRNSMLDHMSEQGLTIGAKTDVPWRVKRIALNLDQIERYSPPPNPAKTTDGRYQRYVEETGLDESWELDALDPTVLSDLIQDELDLLRDDDLWGEEEFKATTEKSTLVGVGNWWDDVSTFIGGKS
jgi:hypothetical protein